MNTIELMMNLSTSIQKMKVSIERLSEILDNKLYKDEKFGIVSKTDILGNMFLIQNEPLKLEFKMLK